MPQVETKYFGTMAYPEESVFDFPFGLPGFEDQNRFVLIEMGQHAPLCFLQSVSRRELCFLALPILVVDRNYQLAVSADDLAAIELDTERQPQLGGEAAVLALVSLHDHFSATANLMAPVVVNLKTRRALQAIRCDSLYSHQHPIVAETSARESELPC
jgi:flagellar assembly factor FliW